MRRRKLLSPLSFLSPFNLSCLLRPSSARSLLPYPSRLIVLSSLLAFRVALSLYAPRKRGRDTHEVLHVFDVSGGADYDGLIIDDDKNLMRKMFRGGKQRKHGGNVRLRYFSTTIRTHSIRASHPSYRQLLPFFAQENKN